MTHRITKMNADNLKTDFDRDGFVIVRDLLRPDEFARLTGELDRYIAETVPRLPDSDAFFVDKNRPETLKQLQHMAADSFFNDYRQHPAWNQLAELLLGEPAAAQAPEWFNKPPGSGSPTPPHQDNYYFNLTPPSVVTIWMALDVVDEDNGCLRYVSGSHHEGVRRHARSDVLGFSQHIVDYGPEESAREIAVALNPGDVVAHHGNTIHRADGNLSDRHRSAFAMVFYGASCRRDEAAYDRYLAGLKQQHETLGLNT